MKIRFNKPYLSGKELYYISQAISEGKTAGNQAYTAMCHEFFQEKFGFQKVLLTTSCTDGLEMAALLLDLEPGDEVILPSYTFVSTANAFILRGAKLVFCDSNSDEPNIDASSIEALITPRTKAIVVVHYAGVACDMGQVMKIAQKHNLYVIEDAAQAIDSYYKDQPLGGIGDIGTFSFHETKNIISGEGGLLIINKPEYKERAEIIWEKGTNRSAFFRGEVDKYGWVDVGSSFLPSEMVAAFLYAQLEHLEEIQQKRKAIWERYNLELRDLSDKGKARLPVLPDYATNNGHLFYLVCESENQRSALINHLQRKDIHAVFHYQSLHSSKYFLDKHDGRELRNADLYTRCLLRLPLFFELSSEMQARVISEVSAFYD